MHLLKVVEINHFKQNISEIKTQEYKEEHNMFTEFINMYAMEIMHAICLAFIGWLGVVAKGLATRYINTDTKRAVAKTAMLAVEQLYKDIHGPEKMQKALLIASGMLEEQGIHITTNELKMLIEAALGEFNANFVTVETGIPLNGPQQGEAANTTFTDPDEYLKREV